MNTKRQKKLTAAVVLLSAAFFTAAFLFYWKIYRVEPAFSEAAYELGEPVSSDPCDYITGTRWSLSLARLDLSEVDGKRPGSYEAVLRHGGRTFTYSILIQDTTAPRIQPKEGRLYLAVGVQVGPEDVVSAISDADEDVETYFVQDGQRYSFLTFDQPGEYTMEVWAEDSSGNRTRTDVEAVADMPPDLEGVRDFYMIPDSRPDYLANVTAKDDVDGDLTGNITVDDSQVSLDREGVYELTYCVADGYGLVTKEQALVTVASPEEIQNMIGSRQISRRDSTILGAPNLYDAGAMEEDNLEEALSYMRPALVQLYHEKPNGYSAGSGYVMEITEDTVYICSNRHVTDKYDNWDVFFYDGTKVAGELLGSSNRYDVGVVVVKREDIPAHLQEQLMTVHIDKTYWMGLDEQAVDLGLERVDREGGLLHVTTGSLVKVKQDFEWEDRQDHTEMTVALEHGDSGSAILDGRGNLISMAYAYSTDPTRYWSVPLDAILECYEEITGRKVFVY